LGNYTEAGASQRSERFWGSMEWRRCWGDSRSRTIF